MARGQETHRRPTPTIAIKGCLGTATDGGCVRQEAMELAKACKLGIRELCDRVGLCHDVTLVVGEHIVGEVVVVPRWDNMTRAEG